MTMMATTRRLTLLMVCMVTSHTRSFAGFASPEMGATTRWLELRYSALETKLGRRGELSLIFTICGDRELHWTNSTKYDNRLKLVPLWHAKLTKGRNACHT